MANGAAVLTPSQDDNPEEGGEFLLRSGPRSGLKREFVFALKAQSQFTDPLGRTRSSRKDAPSSIPSCNGVVAAAAAVDDGQSASNKRQKKSSGDAEKSPVKEDRFGVKTPIPADPIDLDDGSTDRLRRRFTRSALKADHSKGAAVVGEADAVSSSWKNEVVRKEKTGNAGSPLRTSTKKKLELKMSKKIVLDNFPSNVKELLATGLLEGLGVKYRFRGHKVGSLCGKIKDGGILCSCSSCQGLIVLTAAKFERHAGSRNRYAEQIYLDNGKNLRQILDACKSAPLNMLETTIQSAIGTSPVKKAAICQKCKETFHPSRLGKPPLVCKRCQAPKQPRASCTPRPIQSAIGTLPVKKAAICQKCKETFHPSRLGKPPLVCKRCRAPNQPQARCTPRAIQSAIGTSLVKKAVICQKCKETFHPSRLGKPPLVCKRCRALKKPQASCTPRAAKLLKQALIRKSSKSTSKCNPLQKKNGRLTRKDLRLHKLVFMEDVLPDGTEVGYYSHGKKLLEGYKKGNGIFCNCCNSEVAPSQFEAHAGCASRRKPYQYIYTSNGVSLHELSISLSKGRKFSASDNDDLCIICADGGNLVLCDGCPRAFHKDCAELTSIPRGDWYCRYCQTMFEREKFVEHNDNAFAAGRVLGVDPIEQISKRCIRIVQTLEADVSVCVLCRCHDFSKSGFGPRTVLLCDQCEKEFHVGCLKDHKMGDLKELPKKKWFCCMSCSSIHAALENLLHDGFKKLPDSLSDVIMRKREEKVLSDGAELDVRWRLLSGKFASPDSRLLLSKAVSIFHSCFDPIIDSTTGRDLIPSMVYGRNMRDREFGGMFCAVLTVNSSVVCAGLLRVFGQELAELPLVATSGEKQGQGYFQVLFSCIETLLGSLNVRNLLLPAAEEAESIWTKKFGFEKINPEQLSKHTKDSHMMIFQGTSMLHKLIPNCQDASKSAEGSS